MRLEVTKSHSTDRMRLHKYRGSLFRHPGVFCCWGNYCWLAIDLWRGHYSVFFNLLFHHVIWWLHSSATPGNYPLSRPGLPPLHTTSVLLWESPGSCYLNALPCHQRFFLAWLLACAELFASLSVCLRPWEEKNQATYVNVSGGTDLVY